ncbi:AMP-binding protein [Cupriavidus taiwanensis]|uniref:AMP-binding protein n=1 Tax=Cupriavidus taiwanensis TaxID=164546 RepID=UPI000E12C9CF|nr:AMP-binding protein [Cupriavidus taiwanensis]SOY66176.1 putative enzyme; Acyl-coenzyme A synthetases/AMP-(fatty) acid ligases domain [Cupriavidus taiwanensis]SOY66180.1 putative enzyme; Acyl-coenzyme A synthetases/AMP-(fatty) acid ligases domain [Cupriavidus taiwanensis]SOY94258.1 putative enzyme; Acyl-coenzyme A synthetases/AMP-(fatty) acid ligases domain [Cupriavidus taiwanensis]SOZ27844.1 putative enzyme; Acyl-coenzyme A synthetases/AMP-(fatty) acid ligases domain [Cupriavidus taiwanensis
MTSLPIVAHATPGDIIAWAHGRPVTVRQLLADAACLAAALPAGGHVFNACTDRYRFTVGLCAALLAGKPTLLPPSHTPETVRQLLAFAPDTFCLHDQPDAAFDMPALHYHEGLAATAPTAADGPVEIPRIPAAQVMAYVFTSGSTGTPVPHRKTWGAMAGSARAAAQRLGLLDGRAWTLAGTVPPQHMFGLEATVMLVLQGRAALVAAPAFYPADVSAALAAVPAPRALVSSPVHLRMLAQSGLAMPAADLVLCATAPLGRQLAAETEALFAAPLCEIYGSTETGQLATRRTAREDAWTLVPGVRLQARPNAAGDDTETWAEGGHIEQPVPLGDAIAQLDEQRFLLHGRKADLLNIAGKRTSLGYLNHQLTAIDGVRDGAFFMPDDAHEGDGHVVRLVAVVVAPDLAPARLQQALRERIDPAFMPRPLYFAEHLPRNAAGKLPREALAALVASLCGTHERHPAPLPGFVIDAGHPAMAGHFPGHPIVPGVVLLDHAVLALGAALGRPLAVAQASMLKFLSPVRPGERVEVLHQSEAASGGDQTIRFTLRSAGRDVASGTLQVRASAPPAGALPC